jgi:hypothetical protein
MTHTIATQCVATSRVGRDDAERLQRPIKTAKRVEATMSDNLSGG